MADLVGEKLPGEGQKQSRGRRSQVRSKVPTLPAVVVFALLQSVLNSGECSLQSSASCAKVIRAKSCVL